MNGVQGVEGSNPFIPTRKQKPQGIYGNVGPFSVFGRLRIRPCFRPEGRQVGKACPGGYGRAYELPRRSPNHGDGIGPGRPGRQQTNPLSTNKNATKVSSVAFFVCAKHPGSANSRHAFGNSAVPLSAGTKTSRDGPRVPLRLPSGKGACGNSGLRLHPAF